MFSSPLLPSRLHLREHFRFRYGAHLSKEQVAELVRPYPDTLELVRSWLKHYGVRSSSVSTTHGGAWLTVANVLISQANQLLGASYQLYRHTETNDTIIRTVGYAIPAMLHTHIQAVAPTTCFACTRVLRQTPRKRSFGTAASQAEVASRKPVKVLSRRDGEIMPSFLRWLYKTVEYTPAANDKNTFGVVGFVKEYPSQADLTNFVTKFDSEAEASTFTVVPVNGGEDDPNLPGTEEASIDIQYASAMAYPTPIIFYSVGGGGEWSDDTGEPLPGDSYNEWLKYMLDLQKIPQTISISYGFAELAFPLEYAIAVCRLFAQLGARGVSVLYPSGDDGVGPGTCKDGSGNVRFIPEFPSSCTFGRLPSLPNHHTDQVQATN